MTGSPRDDVRARNLARLTALAREQIREAGVEGLSVRAIARAMSMASSAMYRYVRSRDELLTLVIADAYAELAEAVDARLAARSADPPEARLTALGHAVRDWALADPATYALLFGTPVRGYHAPEEVTNPAGTRVAVRIGEILAERPASVRAHEALPEPLAADLARVRSDMPQAGLRDDAGVLDAMTVWPAIFGLVTFELFGQFGPTLSEPGQFFDEAMERLVLLAFGARRDG